MGHVVRIRIRRHGGLGLAAGEVRVAPQPRQRGQETGQVMLRLEAGVDGP